jgi:hypothetical protein
MRKIFLSFLSVYEEFTFPILTQKLKAKNPLAKDKNNLIFLFMQETGAHDPSQSVPDWRQGLYHVEEVGCEERDCGYSANCHQVYLSLSPSVFLSVYSSLSVPLSLTPVCLSLSLSFVFLVVCSTILQKRFDASTNTAATGYSANYH